jgi:hypothetical protein
MFPEGGQTRKDCFLAMFPEGWPTKERNVNIFRCFLHFPGWKHLIEKTITLIYGYYWYNVEYLPLDQSQQLEETKVDLHQASCIHTP